MTHFYWGLCSRTHFVVIANIFYKILHSAHFVQCVLSHLAIESHEDKKVLMIFLYWRGAPADLLDN